MAESISVRLGSEAEKALRRLEDSGMTRSEAIRSALILASRGLDRKRIIAAQSAELEADEADRAEMLAIADFMDSLDTPEPLRATG